MFWNGAFKNISAESGVCYSVDKHFFSKLGVLCKNLDPRYAALVKLFVG